MKQLMQRSFGRLISISLILSVCLCSCDDEDEGFAITNDLRVLYVSIDGDRVQSGAADVQVTAAVEMVFSHPLNRADFENALNISPALDYTVTYDESSSFVKIQPSSRLAYDESYMISLPQGTYGADGVSTKDDFSYQFSTGSFVPPTITLTVDKSSFFEGEVATVTATLSNVVFEDVTFDLVFTGSATGGGVDYTASATNLTIPAEQTEVSFTITSIDGDEIEGNEVIIISPENIVNAVYTADPLILSIGDKAPSMELKGVMELDDFDATGGQIRAIQLNVLKDIADLSIFHIQIASNGAEPDPADIDFAFPAQAASAGDKLLVIRDQDAERAAAYFGSGYAIFTEFQSPGMTHNGDDAILLYENGVSIESFGEPGVDGTGLYWEYTNSWAYKMGEDWYYAGVGCAESLVDVTDATSPCTYPEFSPGMEFKGIMDLNHSGNNLRAYHLFALKDIPDLSVFGAGIASNGQATSDGVEIVLPNIEVKAGEHILLIRDQDVDNAAAYFEGCFSKFDHVIPTDGLTSNGDDTIELFKDNTLIETYGELGVDGTGMFWEYDNSWAYKVSGKWTYGGVGCSTDATTNATSSCPYTFCN